MICDFCGETVLFESVCPHCVKTKARVKEVANKLQEKFDKIYTFEDTIPSMYELLEELGLK